MGGKGKKRGGGSSVKKPPEGLDPRWIDLARFLGQFGPRAKMFLPIFYRLRWGVPEASTFMNTCGGFEGMLRMVLEDADYDVDELEVELVPVGRQDAGRDAGRVESGVSTSSVAEDDGDRKRVVQGLVKVRESMVYRMVIDVNLRPFFETTVPAGALEPDTRVMVPVVPVVGNVGAALLDDGHVGAFERVLNPVGGVVGAAHVSDAEEAVAPDIVGVGSVGQVDVLPKFGCAICRQSFGRLSDLGVHVGSVHPFKSRGKLKARQLRIQEKPFLCLVCGDKRFFDMRDMERHMRVHGDFPVTFTCSCGDMFTRLDNMQKHVKTGRCRRKKERKRLKVAPGGIGVAFGMVMKMQYDFVSYAEDRQDHRSTIDFGFLQRLYVRSTWFGSYIQPSCGFEAEGYILDELGGLVDLDEKYGCAVCGFTAEQISRLRLHVMSHDMVGSKVYKCMLCGVCVASTSSLGRHMHVHSTKEKYRCECGKIFTEHYNYTRHRTKSTRCYSVRSALVKQRQIA